MTKNETMAAEAVNLRLHLLGGFRVSLGPHTIIDDDWRLRKASTLLKLLALASGHRLHREEVLDYLWPDLDTGAGNNNLHQTLHTVRRTLERRGVGGSVSLQLRGGVLALCPSASLWTDVEAFETAAKVARRGQDPAAFQAAIDLYTGDLLPEDRYEDWAAPRRDSLRELYLELLLKLGQIYEARFDYTAAIDVLQRVLAIEGAHEEAHVGLMRLYALMGRRHQALRQYQVLEESLRQDLDAEPTASSQHAYRAIRDGSFSPEMKSDSAPVPRSHRSSEQGQASLGVNHLPGRRIDTPPNNLPMQLTSFVGRQRELAELRGLLGSTRLLTLTGAGGCGKTRLALQFASELLTDFADGVWLVELASLTQAELVPGAVATVLGVPEQPGRPPLDSLVAGLRGKALLLLLDNCEHLVDACGQLVHKLLHGCPQVRLLTTSREPLRVAGEVAWRVPSLPVPDPQQPSLDALARVEAFQLFVDRARAVLPDFSATAENASTIMQICSRLDGLPLAIELAAPWVRTLSVEQILSRLDNCLNLLAGGSRTAPTRQQTLAATLAWSHDLLTAPEMAIFRRLAVFRGGFSLAAVEAICAGDGIEPAEVLALLTQLVDKSLVVVQERGEEVRYRLLEPVRQYACLRLQAAGESTKLYAHHLDWCIRLAELAAPMLWRADQGWWLDRVTMEHDNLRAALGWSLSEAGDAEAGVRLVASLWPFWLLRGHLMEGRQWLADAAAQAVKPTTSLASALLGVYALAIRHGDPRGAQAAAARSFAAYQNLMERTGASRALHNLGVVDWLQGDYEEARARFSEGLRLADEADDRLGRALATHSLGVLAWSTGDHRQAEASLRETIDLVEDGGMEPGFPSPVLNQGWLERRGAGGQRRVVIEETLVLFREVGTATLVGQALANLGNLARADGEGDRAWALLEESLALFQRVGDHVGAGITLAQLGNLAAWEGDSDHARMLLEQSLAVREEIGDRRGIGMTLASLGRLAAADGEHTGARALLEQSLALFRQIGDKPGVAIASGELGNLVSSDGDTESGEALLEESLAVFGDLGVKLGEALCHRDLGLLEQARGNPLAARRHFEASLALFQRLGDQRHVSLLSDDLARPALSFHRTSVDRLPIREVPAGADS